MIRTSVILGTIILAVSSAWGAPAETPAVTDEEAVKQVVAGMVEAWNRHDMKAMAALFAEDADFVNVIGMWWKGRAEIEQQHVAMHATRFKDSHLTAVVAKVRLLKPDVAVAHITWNLAGDKGPNGQASGARRGIMTQTLVNRDGSWSIVTCQNTDIVLAIPKK